MGTGGRARAIGSCVAVACIAYAGSPLVGQTSHASVASSLEKAAAYLSEYRLSLSSILLEELYTQTDVRPAGSMRATRHRVLRSDLMLMNTEATDWLAFRNVLEVDGRPVPNRNARLEDLFAKGFSADAARQAQRIMDESARYNLGGVDRNLNVPTMALAYLERRHQSRSTWSPGRPDAVDGVPADVLEFEEQPGPTLIRSAAGDLRGSGRFWLQHGTGRVLKSDLLVQGHISTARLTVVYGAAAGIDLLVPLRMQERYVTPTETVTAEAAYSRFRRVGVSVDTSFNVQERGFSGHWVLQSGTLDLFGRAFRITQTRNTIFIDADRDVTLHLEYALDGSESRNVLPAHGNIAEVATTSIAAWHGPSLVIETRRAGAADAAVKRTFSLTSDGRLTVQTETGGQTHTAVYTRVDKF